MGVWWYDRHPMVTPTITHAPISFKTHFKTYFRTTGAGRYDRHPMIIRTLYHRANFDTMDPWGWGGMTGTR